METEHPAAPALRGSFSLEQIRRWALAGLAEEANSPQLIAMLRQHLAASKEAPST